MRESFADRLRELREAKGLSQQQLATKMFVDRSSIARWESGARTPDMFLVHRLAECLGVGPAELFSAEPHDETPCVILVDDERPILAGELRVLEKTLAGSEICGFTRPDEALQYARANRVHLAFLDIEMGKTSGFDVCEELVKINPSTNVVYLTAWPNHSLKAWETNACGFLLKPLLETDVQGVLGKLKHPIPRLLGGY